MCNARRLSQGLLPITVVVILWTGLASPVLAEVSLPQVFGSHMVLQRDIAIPLWGWAEPGEEVTVSFAGQEVRATTGQDGRWKVRLEPVQQSAEGRTLIVSGKNQLSLDDVLVGDVWICSGQSNMEWPLQRTMQADREIEAADFPKIRFFDIPHDNDPQPQKDIRHGNWRVCAPATARSFSAVGYFFGRELFRETDVPIGLIGSNWGGTRIEPWTPPEGFQAVAELSSITRKLNRHHPSSETGHQQSLAFIAAVEEWLPAARAAAEDRTWIPPLPQNPVPSRHTAPAQLYKGMIHPIVPYAIRGAIWYQGESNGGEKTSYFHKMQALIGGWRQVWGQGDFPFYYVQLANFRSSTDNPAGGDGWAGLREAQRQALTIPNTGMAVIMDIGEAKNIHPANKQDVGKRLARWALADVYGKDIVRSGPLYKAHKVEGNRIHLSFDHVGSGLMVGEKQGLTPTREIADGKLKEFAIAGDDHQWHWAEAVIDGETVVVSAEAVPVPVAVRYAYSMNPEDANLYNREGLPASPFRTDDW